VYAATRPAAQRDRDGPMRLTHSSQEDLWRQIRRRILAETSAFLSTGLERPELGVSIPIIPAGRGRFGRAFAQAFWDRVFAER
jgi:hypothetical protein